MVTVLPLFLSLACSQLSGQQQRQPTANRVQDNSGMPVQLQQQYQKH